MRPAMDANARAAVAAAAASYGTLAAFGVTAATATFGQLAVATVVGAFAQSAVSGTIPSNAKRRIA